MAGKALSTAAKNANTASKAVKGDKGVKALEQMVSAIYMCSVAAHNMGGTTRVMKAFSAIDRELTKFIKDYKVTFGDD